MKISHLAAAAGVHVETIRYYQRRGLLRAPERPPNGARRYGATDVGRLQFIRRAQTMGFSLDEIASLLAVEGRGACVQTQVFVERKLDEVRQRLESLQQLEADLKQLLGRCRQVADGDACPAMQLMANATLSEERP